MASANLMTLKALYNRTYVELKYDQTGGDCDEHPVL